jgi:hypothetical protein
MHYHPPTPLLSQILEPIPGLHMLHTEIAALILKVLAVHRKQLTKHLTFNLIDEIVNSISINKASLLGVMSMQVEIEG